MLGRLRGWFRSRRSTPAPAPASASAPAPAPAAAVADDDPWAPFDVAIEADPLGPDVVGELAASILDELAAAPLVIPPFPSAAARVLELVQRPELDLNELVRVIHWEPAVASELLVAANSAAFARAPLDDLRSAVLALGVQQVGAIATAVSARSLFDVDSRAQFELFPALWQAAYRETLVTAFAASWLAQIRRVPRHDRVFLRAVILGIGRTLALRALASRTLAGRQAKVPTPAIVAAVDRVHAEVATRAVAGWALPASVTAAIDPANEVERTVVQFASALVQLRRAPDAELVLRGRELAGMLGLDRRWVRVAIHEVGELEQRITAGLPGAGVGRAA